MQTKNLITVSLAALATGIFAGCQTVQQPVENQTVTPTGQSTSTVQITNNTGLDQETGMTMQKIVKPEDVSQTDRDAFMKADAEKNPQLCDGITVASYKKLCVEQASDKNAPPMAAAATQEKCKSTSEKDGVKNCVNFEE